MKARHDWYLREWLQMLGKRQADVVRDLDWNKARVSLTVSGKQPYTRDDVAEIAAYLNIREYELLMHPEQAMALRRFEASARDVINIVHDADEGDGLRDGTHG